MNDEFLKSQEEQEFVGASKNGVGAINMALLFGTAAIALTLILTPFLTKEGESQQASTIGYDDIKTGSIPTEDGKVKRYTIRRSVLNQNPGDVCIIDQAGNRNGC
jgi:hypothetical protein